MYLDNESVEELEIDELEAMEKKVVSLYLMNAAKFKLTLAS